jgi:hypothetical protein
MDVRDYGGGEDSVRTAAHAEVARRQPEKCQGCFSPQKVVQRDEAKGEETRGVAAVKKNASSRMPVLLSLSVTRSSQLRWRGRYASVSSTVTRLAKEVQSVEIAERVHAGELTYAQGERLSMFLDLERLGLAHRYYPRSVFAARKREARKLGYAMSDEGAESLTVKLAELLRPYLEAVRAGGAAVGRL